VYLYNAVEKPAGDIYYTHCFPGKIQKVVQDKMVRDKNDA